MSRCVPLTLKAFGVGKKKTSNRKWKLLFAQSWKLSTMSLIAIRVFLSLVSSRLASLWSRSFIALMRRNYICSWDEWNAEAIINSLSGKFLQVSMPLQTGICSCNNSGCFDIITMFTENALCVSSSRVLTRLGIMMLRTTLIIWIELWVKRDVKRWQTFN